MIDNLEALLEKRIDETEALIKKSDQNQVKSIKDLDKRLTGLKTTDVDKSKIVTIQMMDTMTSNMYKKIDEIHDELKKSEQSQIKSIKDLDKKVKDIKVPELDKINFASASMFEAFVHEVEKKITEMDDQMEKTNQTQSKSIKDLDKRIKDIKIPDLEKLNYVNRPLIDQIVGALDHKITEMDEQIDTLEKNQIKLSKDIENKIKQIKTPEVDKQGVASMPGIDSKIAALDRKIDEVEDSLNKFEQTQSKSIKDLDKKIKDIKIPDLEKTNFVTKPMMDTLAGQIDKKIEATDDSQKKLIKDLDNKIKQIKAPESEHQSIDTKPIIDNLTVLINKKTIEIEQSQDKSIKEIDKKLKVIDVLYI